MVKNGLMLLVLDYFHVAEYEFNFKVNMIGKVASYSLDLYKDYIVDVCLCKNVENASELRDKIIQGKLNCTLMNTKYILDIFPVLLAANKAVHSFLNSSMKTRNVHAEILYNLSPSTSINESLKKFGISKDDKALLLVIIRKTTESHTKEIIEQIQGEVNNLDTLKDTCFEKEIIDFYKISEEELQLGTIADAITVRVASKDAL